MTASTADATNAIWICAGLSLTALITRLVLCRQHARHRFSLDISSWVVLASIVVISARIVCSYFTLNIGTANDQILSGDIGLDDQQRIKTGSILALISRILVASVYWLQSTLLLIFYSRLLDHIPWVHVTIRICWIFLVASYIGVVLATCLECRPFRLYWQTSPDPGECIKAYGQLFAQCISIMIIDILLLMISFPLIRLRGQTSRQKGRLVIIYALGGCCIIITGIRIAYIYVDHSAQPTRSLWASIQAVFAVYVANIPTIYGTLALKRRRNSITHSGYHQNHEFSSSFSLPCKRARESFVRLGSRGGIGKAVEISLRSSSERGHSIGTAVSDDTPLHPPTRYASIVQEEVRHPDEVYFQHVEYGKPRRLSTHGMSRDDEVGPC